MESLPPASPPQGPLAWNASTLLHNDAGAYLPHLRDNVPGIWEPGAWSLPGGGAEPGDRSLEETARRELREETGLELPSLRSPGMPGRVGDEEGLAADDQTVRYPQGEVDPSAGCGGPEQGVGLPRRADRWAAGGARRPGGEAEAGDGRGGQVQGGADEQRALRGEGGHQHATDDEPAELGAHRPAYRSRLAGDPVAAAIVRAGFGAHWIADFLAPAPTGDRHPSIEAELARLRATPAGTAHADLAVSLGRALPAGLRRSDVAGRAADLLEWVWAETLRPYWPRWRRIIEADIMARTERLSRGGWAAALEGMGPGVRWLGGGRLQINTRACPPRELRGADLLFVPVTPRRGWVAWDEPHRYAVVYPCDGVLAGVERGPAPEPLRALLGAARADVLLLLGAPRSTTHLVALTGQGLGSVGRHLRLLHDAGLVRRRRAGRSVLYLRTDTGDLLVKAQRTERL